MKTTFNTNDDNNLDYSLGQKLVGMKKLKDNKIMEKDIANYEYVNKHVFNNLLKPLITEYTRSNNVFIGTDRSSKTLRLLFERIDLIHPSVAKYLVRYLMKQALVEKENDLPILSPKLIVSQLREVFDNDQWNIGIDEWKSIEINIHYFDDEAYGEMVKYIYYFMRTAPNNTSSMLHDVRNGKTKLSDDMLLDIKDATIATSRTLYIIDISNTYHNDENTFDTMQKNRLLYYISQFVLAEGIPDFGRYSEVLIRNPLTNTEVSLKIDGFTKLRRYTKDSNYDLQKFWAMAYKNKDESTKGRIG